VDTGSLEAPSPRIAGLDPTSPRRAGEEDPPTARFFQLPSGLDRHSVRRFLGLAADRDGLLESRGTGFCPTGTGRGVIVPWSIYPDCARRRSGLTRGLQRRLGSTGGVFPSALVRATCRPSAEASAGEDVRAASPTSFPARHRTASRPYRRPRPPISVPPSSCDPDLARRPPRSLRRAPHDRP